MLLAVFQAPCIASGQNICVGVHRKIARENLRGSSLLLHPGVLCAEILTGNRPPRELLLQPASGGKAGHQTCCPECNGRWQPDPAQPVPLFQ